MGLSNDLISQFVKVTNDVKKEKTEKTMYGKVIVENGTTYVRLDGSSLNTPIATTSNVKHGDRVMVLIKNHSATVIGNVSSPSTTVSDVAGINNKISEFETVIAGKVDADDLNAQSARIDTLNSDVVLVKKDLLATQGTIETLQADTVDVKERLTAAVADIENLDATKLDAEIAEVTYATITNLNASNATISDLQSDYGDFKTLVTDKLEADEADIQSLKANKLSASTAAITYAKISDLNAATADITDLESTFSDFQVATANNFSAVNASIESLQAGKLSATDIEGKYANIDFSNIGQAAMEYLYSQSGLIKNVVVGEASITGQLAGVTISGDLIEANTVKAEKLVIKGSDGLYYKLNTAGATVESEQTDQNSLNGSIILAKSVTASKINVDDLVAFDATIGGFKITGNSIYSGVKTTATNTTHGIYLDNDGQASFGDATNYLKYYKTSDGAYKLDISASSILLSTSNKNVETVLNENATAISTAQSTVNSAKNDISALTTRISDAETQIDQNVDDILLRATKTEVSTAKSEAISTAASDATTKANNALTSAKSYADAQIKVSADSIASTVNSVKVIAEGAQDDVNSLTTRVTTAESTISQHTDAIELRATKTELSTVSTIASNAQSTANANKTNLANNYYTKTQTDAKIKVESDKITSAVSRISANETAISTLEQTADGLEVRLDTTDSNVATAQSTANTANTTANSVKTDLANNYTKKTLPDTRNDNQPPSWYFENYPKQIITEFKYCSKIGLSGVGTYCSLQTIVPWNDSSGGYPKQTAKVETTGKEFWRVGTSATAWSDWIDAYGLASTANSTANTANTNATNAAKTATNFLSYDSTNGLLIGNKSSGSWSGARAQITSSAFNILDQNGTTLASYGSTTTIGKTSGNNLYIDSDSIDIRKNGKVLATFDQYGLKIANTNDSSGSLGSGTTKPALVLGTATGYHIEMDNNEIMAKSDATTSSHLFLNMEGGNVSFNNNANRAMMFQEGALYAKNASFNSGNYLGVLDALNDSGNTTLGYGGYNNKIGGTNIYGNSVSIVSNGDLNVEASWIRCRSIAPNDHATYALGVYGEKGWSNIYLGKGDNKTNALHIINGSSTYLLCGVNSSGQYVFGNNAAVMYYQVKDVGTDNTGNAFKVTSGNNTASNNTNSVWLFGGADTTSRYIGSYMAYSRTYSSAANMVVTANGIFGRSTSSSERYKNSIVEADISELKSLYDLPVKKFKYNDDYIAPDDELYDKYLYGFIVEDLEDILPCAVEHITDEDGTELPEMWNSSIIVPALLKLIQDLNNRVKTLERKE